MIKTLVQLIETGSQPYYGHFTFFFGSSGEIQYIDGAWRYRHIYYEGEWQYVDSPEAINLKDLNELEYSLTQFILTEYSYHILLEPDKFREKQIERALGMDLCNAGVVATKEFMEALREAVTKVLTPKEET